MILSTVGSQDFLSLLQGNLKSLWHQLSTFEWNYFYSLLAISLVVFSLELLFPWRKEQKKIRRDFWLDAFYMFFNIFLFLLIFKVFASYVSGLFENSLDRAGLAWLLTDRVKSLPIWSQLIILFIARDFIQWNVHRLLHRVSWLWQFHKVHHSVKEMGFAAHLRFHWMETVVYNTIQFLPLGMIGFALDQYIGVYVVSILIGHLNHANFKCNYGPLKYLLNNPAMHIWHHAKDLPKGFEKGCNFGLSLSLWDYIFKTNYVPRDGGGVELGYEGDNEMPRSFLKQLFFGFRKNKNDS